VLVLNSMGEEINGTGTKFVVSRNFAKRAGGLEFCFGASLIVSFGSIMNIMHNIAGKGGGFTLFNNGNLLVEGSGTKVAIDGNEGLAGGGVWMRYSSYIAVISGAHFEVVNNVATGEDFQSGGGGLFLMDSGTRLDVEGKRQVPR
jgi:hypothetical protein